LRDLAWLPGEREDVPALMQSFDCFALPSLAEGVSNTVLEAMATQLPVVATRVGANAQLVEHGLSGTLVPASDSAALAAAIVTYFGDPALSRRHGRAGRQLAEKRFSIGRMVDRYHSLYSSALSPGVSGELLDVETAPRGRRV
jgi:glycosyltransferase involved in cell wall biosynthesis